MMSTNNVAKTTEKEMVEVGTGMEEIFRKRDAENYFKALKAEEDRKRNELRRKRQMEKLLKKTFLAKTIVKIIIGVLYISSLLNLGSVLDATDAGYYTALLAIIVYSIIYFKTLSALYKYIRRVINYSIKLF